MRGIRTVRPENDDDDNDDDDDDDDDDDHNGDIRGDGTGRAQPAQR